MIVLNCFYLVYNLKFMNLEKSNYINLELLFSRLMNKWHLSEVVNQKNLCLFTWAYFSTQRYIDFQVRIWLIKNPMLSCLIERGYVSYWWGWVVYNHNLGVGFYWHKLYVYFLMSIIMKDVLESIIAKFFFAKRKDRKIHWVKSMLQKS